MIIDIVKIGNSQGIIIPKNLLEECGITKKVDVEIKNHTIYIKSVNPRNGLAESFKEMRKSGDDKLLIEDNIDLEAIDGDWEW